RCGCIMIQDTNELAEGEFLTADVCIVGAGAAGITIALELIGSGLQVLLLESGGFEPEPETQSLYAGSVVDDRLHSPADRYRERRFGGTTTIWGGRCVPFDALDFAARDYIPASGWPFGLDELLPYYPRANQLCEAGPFAYTIEAAFHQPMRPMIDSFVSANFSTNTLERFSCPTDFGARYRHKLAAARNIRVLLHANVTAVHLDEEGGRVDGADIKTLQGRHASVRADRFIIAAGG